MRGDRIHNEWDGIHKSGDNTQIGMNVSSLGLKKILEQGFYNLLFIFTHVQLSSHFLVLKIELIIVCFQ